MLYSALKVFFVFAGLVFHRINDISLSFCVLIEVFSYECQYMSSSMSSTLSDNSLAQINK